MRIFKYDVHLTGVGGKIHTIRIESPASNITALFLSMNQNRGMFFKALKIYEKTNRMKIKAFEIKSAKEPPQEDYTDPEAHFQCNPYILEDKYDNLIYFDTDMSCVPIFDEFHNIIKQPQ
jgi:hypothetical protein